MPRPTVIPDVRERLEIYLNESESQYLQQAEEKRMPTLPSLPDGKVNVRAVATAINLRVTQEKYLYREDLSALINLVAEGQGLLPIRARLLQDAGDKTIKERMVRQAQSARAAAQAAVEAQAVETAMLDKIRELTVDNEALRSENLRLRAQLDAMDQGLHVRVVN